MRRTALWLLWLGFILYILLFSPPLQPDTFQPIQILLHGQLPSINPVIISLFSLIGIWLLIYSCLVFADGRMQRLPAWVFMLAAVGSGVIGLIPYLALRQPNREFTGSKDVWLSVLDARSTGVILTASAVILLAFGILWGDWAAFAEEFQTNRFVQGMSLAFCIFCLLFPYPTLLSDDRARRDSADDKGSAQKNAQNTWIPWIPLFGALFYLCSRPPLTNK
jgi:hypothetical protein